MCAWYWSDLVRRNSVFIRSLMRVKGLSWSHATIPILQLVLLKFLVLLICRELESHLHTVNLLGTTPTSDHFTHYTPVCPLACPLTRAGPSTLGSNTGCWRWVCKETSADSLCVRDSIKDRHSVDILVQLSGRPPVRKHFSSLPQPTLRI